MLTCNPLPYPGGAEIDLFLGAEADPPRHRPDRNPALAGLPNSVALTIRLERERHPLAQQANKNDRGAPRF